MAQAECQVQAGSVETHRHGAQQHEADKQAVHQSGMICHM